MKEGDLQSFLEKITIRKLTPKLAVDLEKDSYFKGTIILHTGYSIRMLQAFQLAPNTTRIVAYHKEAKTAVGFLCLEKNKRSIYSIKFVFVDPKFRKMGVATKLLSYTLNLAREKGARKAVINVDPSSAEAIDLYKKIGFTEIGRSFGGAGFPSDLLANRGDKRIFLGQKYRVKSKPKKATHLLKLRAISKINRAKLLSIYERCMNQTWTDFFEINANSFISGSRHVWQPSFSRNIVISNKDDSFALVFHRPFFSNATVELYSAADAVLPLMLEELLQILADSGILYVQITLFHAMDEPTSSWFKEKELKTSQYVVMGKTL